MDRQQEIERIAYELYLQRGDASGDALADWFMAERIYIERVESEQPKSESQKIETLEEVKSSDGKRISRVRKNK